MAAQEYYNSFNQPNQQQVPHYPPPQYQPYQNPPQVLNQPAPPPQFNLAENRPNYPQQLQQYNPQAPPQAHPQPQHPYYPPQNPQYLQLPQVQAPHRPHYDDDDDYDDEYDDKNVRPRSSRSVSEPPRHHHHHHHHDRNGARDRSVSRPRQARKRSHSNRSTNTFIGALGGSVIGDAIFPGLGTLGGALLGGGAGYGTARSKSENGRPRRHKRDTYDEEWEEGRRRRGEID